MGAAGAALEILGAHEGQQRREIVVVGGAQGGQVGLAGCAGGIEAVAAQVKGSMPS